MGTHISLFTASAVLGSPCYDVVALLSQSKGNKHVLLTVPFSFCPSAILFQKKCDPVYYVTVTGSDWDLRWLSQATQANTENHQLPRWPWTHPFLWKWEGSSIQSNVRKVNGDWQDGSVGRGTCLQSDDLSLTPGTHSAEEENWPLKVVPWPTHTTWQPQPISNEHKVIKAVAVKEKKKKKGGGEQFTPSYPQNSSTQQRGSWNPRGIPRLSSSRHRELSTGLCLANVLQFATCLCFILSSMEIFRKQKERGCETWWLQGDQGRHWSTQEPPLCELH